jgi:hypothetical protein
MEMKRLPITAELPRHGATRSEGSLWADGANSADAEKGGGRVLAHVFSNGVNRQHDLSMPRTPGRHFLGRNVSWIDAARPLLHEREAWRSIGIVAGTNEGAAQVENVAR